MISFYCVLTQSIGQAREALFALLQPSSQKALLAHFDTVGTPDKFSNLVISLPRSGPMVCLIVPMEVLDQWFALLSLWKF